MLNMSLGKVITAVKTLTLASVSKASKTWWKHWKSYRMKWCELREYKWNEYVTIAVNRNFSNCEKDRKKGFRGFNGIRPVASALALQYSTSLSYEDPYTGGLPIYWIHQPVKGMKHRMKWCELREYKWNEYVTIAVNRNLSNCEKDRKKKDFGASTGFEPLASAMVMITYSFHLWNVIRFIIRFCFVFVNDVWWNK